MITRVVYTTPEQRQKLIDALSVVRSIYGLARAEGHPTLEPLSAAVLEPMKELIAELDIVNHGVNLP